MFQHRDFFQAFATRRRANASTICPGHLNVLQVLHALHVRKVASAGEKIGVNEVLVLKSTSSSSFAEGTAPWPSLLLSDCPLEELADTNVFWEPENFSAGSSSAQDKVSSSKGFRAPCSCGKLIVLSLDVRFAIMPLSTLGVSTSPPKVPDPEIIGGRGDLRSEVEAKSLGNGTDGPFSLFETISRSVSFSSGCLVE